MKGSASKETGVLQRRGPETQKFGIKRVGEGNMSKAVRKKKKKTLRDSKGENLRKTKLNSYQPTIARIVLVITIIIIIIIITIIITIMIVIITCKQIIKLIADVSASS